MSHPFFAAMPLIPGQPWKTPDFNVAFCKAEKVLHV
jgi:hypothetical protein